MSEMWIRTGSALPDTSGRAATPFLSWGVKYRDTPVFLDQAAGEEPFPAAVAAEPEVDPEAVAMESFAQGLAEGRRVAGVEHADERRAMQQIVAMLETLQPEPPAALAGLIAETVGRLVRQIVGEAAVDGDLLLARAEAAAALVVEETKPRLRLSPADKLRLADAELAIELVADPALCPGTILIETSDGWIEDGPQAALARLATQLDRMGVAR
jgi:flagellar assembly protein FliH